MKTTLYPMQTYHLAPSEDDWELFIEGRQKPLASFETKKDAMAHSVALVAERNGSLKIHRADGTIEEERTYPGSPDM